MIKTNGLGLYFTAKVMNQISSWLQRGRNVTGVCSFDEQWNLNMQSVDVCSLNYCCIYSISVKGRTEICFLFSCQKLKQMVTQLVD